MWPKRKKPADTTDFDDQGAVDPSVVDLEVSEPEQLTPKLIAEARHRAVRLLARREHGRYELREKLLQRDFRADAVDSALDQLAEKGLQCDVRFAESYTRMRINRGFGANKVRADLQSRRLSREVIEDALAENGADWSDNAYNALLKKFGDPDNACGRVTAEKDFGDRSADRARMQRFLHSRGYSPAQIGSAINRVRQRVQ